MHLAEYCKENFIFKSEKTPNLIFKYEIKITGKKKPWKKCVPENKKNQKIIMMYSVSIYYSLDILTTLNDYIYWHIRNFTLTYMDTHKNKNRNSFPLYLCHI